MAAETLATIDLKISALMVARNIESKLTDKGLGRLADRVMDSPEFYDNPSELVDCINAVREALRYD